MAVALSGSSCPWDPELKSFSVILRMVLFQSQLHFLARLHARDSCVKRLSRKEPEHCVHSVFRSGYSLQT
jgi:hypothetical protein